MNATVKGYAVAQFEKNGKYTIHLAKESVHNRGFYYEMDIR